ncbi:MAG: glycosyltransferase family 2 protein, partial [Acidimicrobiales bacterium]
MAELPSTDGALIRVWAIGAPAELDLRALRVGGAPTAEADGFELTTTDDDHGLWRQLAETRPHVVLTFGDVEHHQHLAAAPLSVRRRWIHAAGQALPELAAQVLHTFVTEATGDRFPDVPLVSVFTCTYRTGAAVRTAYESLLAQTHQDWEWVVYDDSDDDGATFGVLTELAAVDPRVQPFRGVGNDGSIGAVKRRACGLCRGSLVVELDHDDRLLPRCLELVVAAARQHPEAGFFYSDGAEVLQDGSAAGYPDGWAFGFGAYRTEVIEGRPLLVQCYPPVNAKTIRHITSAPNHVRAWRASAYQRCGGHSPDLIVCDDFDLCLRMFLTTRMVHIPECCYIQVHREGANAQRRRNREIQRLTQALLQRYHHELHARFEDLGIDDFIWTGDGTLDWARPGPPDGAPA